MRPMGLWGFQVRALGQMRGRGRDERETIEWVFGEMRGKRRDDREMFRSS